MKKNYWFFLTIFIAFVSMLTLMPHPMMVAQAEDTEGDEDSETIDEAENAFGRSETFEPGEPTPDDIDEPIDPKEEDGGGRGDGDNTDDDNG